MINESVNLQGEFDFSVFNKDGSLSYNTNSKNFITPSGLSYINFFATADCIRYLSLGSGTGANTILNGGTVALTSGGQSGFSFIGGNSLGTNCSNNTRNQYTSGCGFQTTDSGVKLFRAWRIPTDPSLFFDQSFTFREYQITPGTPAKTGFSAGVPSSACHCNQSVNTQANGLGQTLYGEESYDYYLANTGICNATGAFTRILKDVSVIADQYLIVNYSLNIGLDTGVKRFQITPTLTNPYSGLSGEGYYNWSGVSGKNSIIHQGIKLINDGSITSITQADQINTSYVFRYGESYVPKFGIPMEPSCPLIYRFGYISNDNLIAIVNATGVLSTNIMNTGLYQPYSSSGLAFPNGLIGYFKNGLSSAPNFVYSKPRSERNINTYYPDRTNYKNGNSASFTNFFGTDQSFSPVTLNPPNNGISDSFDSYLATGRSRSKTLSYQFVDPSLVNRIPVRAMVLGYRPLIDSTDGAYNYYPAVDVLFAAINTSLNFVNDPFVDTGNFTYAKPRGLLTNDSLGISGGYNYMDENNILQFQFKLNWSSPCSSGVIGC